MDKKDVEALKNMSLYDVCERLGLEIDPDDKNQFLGGERGHRISIKDGLFYDHNYNSGGKNAINLVCHVLSCDFPKSLVFLSNEYSITPINRPKTIKKASELPKEFKHNWERTRSYLINERGIDHIIIDWLYKHGLIYADKYNNCVFLYGDGCELRGIYKKWRGSRGSLSKLFIIPCNNYPTSLILTESAIDAISYRQLNPNSYVCSIAGDGNHKLIKQAINIAVLYDLSIVSAFDNDKGGEIAHKILLKLSILTNVKICKRKPTKNDWNDQLIN